MTVRGRERMKVCVRAKLSFSERKRDFITISFEYHSASIRHLGCMNLLA